jgi:hypothetical protein
LCSTSGPTLPRPTFRRCFPSRTDRSPSPIEREPEYHPQPLRWQAIRQDLHPSEPFGPRRPRSSRRPAWSRPPSET